MQYRFTKRYRSDFGAYDPGDTAEFDDDTAAWLLRDEPGCIEATTRTITLDEIEAMRSVDEPPHDRQLKAAPKKRGGSAMSTQDSGGLTKGGA